MKTEVTMKREIFGSEISQRSKSEFLSLTDLINVGNRFRVMNNLPITTSNAYFSNSKNKEFIKELSSKYGKVKTDGRGRGNHIWVHPLLFLDIALWLDPKMKVEVYEWLQDHLLKYRNDSGDSYKIMYGALYSKTTNKALFYKHIQIVAKQIKLECGVKNWENATQHQLQLRDKMHEFIAFACDMLKHGRDAVIVGINKAKQSMESKNGKH